MSRVKKLLIVGLILVTGIMLALPFRKTAKPLQSEHQHSGQRTASHQGTQRTQDLSKRPLVTQSNPTGGPRRMAATHSPVAPTTSFDLVNHPAIGNPVGPTSKRPLTPGRPTTGPRTAVPSPPPDLRPAYQTVENPAEQDSKWPREVIHIVQDGDTLEKLADRYLGDTTRALEIFDMNRQKLVNPHQLPIHAELRVPVAPGRMLD